MRINIIFVVLIFPISLCFSCVVSNCLLLLLNLTIHHHYFYYYFIIPLIQGPLFSWPNL